MDPILGYGIIYVKTKFNPKLSESATEIWFVCFWCGTIFVKGELVGG